MKKLLGLSLLFLACCTVAIDAQPPVKAMFADPPLPVVQPAPIAAAPKPPRLKKIFVPFTGKVHTFMHREDMQSKLGGLRRARLPQAKIPVTTLPVDSTNGQKVSCPMDGNDQLGDCGEAMICHADNILTYGQGKSGFTESVFAEAALEAQYKQLSGGDNGMDEDMVVGPQGAWTTGIAGNKQAIAVDHLDFDITNAPLTQYLIDQFYCVQMAWSVPDAFISGFKTGAVFDQAGIPDPANGHFTTQSDVVVAIGATAVKGYYVLWTWGSYCFVGPAFIASIEPQAFVSFSPRQFNPNTGCDSKGRHITTQAAAWVAAGGNAIPASVISAFPPLSAPPVNPPVVNPPTPATGNWTITDPTGQTWTLPPNYQVAQPAGPNPNSPQAVLDFTQGVMSHVLITSITAKNPALEAQRQQVLRLVTAKRAEPEKFNFLGAFQALVQLVSDAFSGNFSALPADFTALIAAFSSTPTAAPVPPKQKSEFRIPSSRVVEFSTRC